jgi:RNA polymerase sigma-70 factor (ECF subfamily)
MDYQPKHEPASEAASEPAQPTPDTDARLLQRIAAGDSVALGLFYDAYSSILFGLALRILNDHKEAEDALQEVFLQVWDKADTYDPSLGRPLAWVITLTRNKAIDRLRSAHRRLKLFEEAGEEIAAKGASSVGTAADAVGMGERAHLVCAALTRLPAEQKHAIELAFFTGLTQSEIAAALNEPLGTIKARIRRGMLKLREELEPWLRAEAREVPAGRRGMTE